VLVIVLPVTFFVLWRIENSRFGLAFRALRDNALVAGSMGVDVARTRMLAWMIGGFVTGVAGCLHAHRVTVLTPTEFGIYVSVTILMGPLLGGLRSFWGTVLGSAVVYFGPWLTTTSEPRDRLMFYGALIVLLMVLRPQGLLAPRSGR
jgi:branched-chain amino acid transport system permease protein